MASRQAQFSAIPSLPQTGLQPWQFYFYTAIKENLEMLTGSRNGVDSSKQSITTGQITVAAPPKQNMVKPSAEGVAVLANKSVSVPAITDYAKLISDVQALANDVSNLRTTVEILINQLKGSK